jgi:alpha-glucosidase
MNFALLVLLAIAQVPAQTPAAVSPDGQVRIELSLRQAGEAQAVPHYRVTRGGTELVASSRLGVELGDGTALGGPCAIVRVTTREVREQYTQVTGKRRNVTSHAAETVVLLRETNPPHRTWEVVLRASHDGAAFRYRFPRQDGWDALALRQERTEFRCPAAARAFALPLGGFTTSYEKRYAVQPLGDLPSHALLGLPLLLEHPAGIWIALTEADVDEYAGLYLAPAAAGPPGGGPPQVRLLAARLSPLPGEPGLAVRHALPHASPWRVILVGDRIGRLVESDLVLNLSPPSAIPDTTWIKSGKTTFPWWNGFFEERVDFTPGLNTATAKHYIDFCAAAGIPYHSLDGVRDTAWYGGPIVPYQGADITRAIDGLDLPAVLEYARSRGVGIRLWMHWQGAEAHLDRAFPLYRKWGIEGVMLDFMDRDDQLMNRFVRRAVKLAAENHLTVTLHGCPKPTGLERTYPNLLTHEGVMNLEYDKWDPQGITPDHELTVPFTRMLAGPLDFHQGSFRAVRPAAFRPRNDAPLVIGTPARTLASYVVYQNHLAMVADYPSAYRGHPGLPLLAAIPTTWDDTQVLDAQVGRFILIARRSGTAWYVGAMTDGSPRTFDLPLRFLPAGRFQALVASDDDSAQFGLSLSRQVVTAGETLRLQLSPAGGGLVQLIPK